MSDIILTILPRVVGAPLVLAVGDGKGLIAMKPMTDLEQTLKKSSTPSMTTWESHTLDALVMVEAAGDMTTLGDVMVVSLLSSSNPHKDAGWHLPLAPTTPVSTPSEGKQGGTLSKGARRPVTDLWHVGSYW